MRMLVRSLQENQAPLRWRGWEGGVDREAFSEKLAPGRLCSHGQSAEGREGDRMLKGGSFKKSLAMSRSGTDLSMSATQVQVCALGVRLEVKGVG